MNSMAEFFTNNIIGVFFFYGLSFFCMGLAVLLESGHSSELDFARALKPLAGFGLIHGAHEWFEMFLLIYPAIAANPANIWISPLRIILLASSFMLFVIFGARLILGPEHARIRWLVFLVIGSVWLLGFLSVIASASFTWQERVIAADVYTRYSLAFPGAILTVWGLMVQRQKFFQAGMTQYGRDLAIAALAFGVYGGIGQLFASPSAIFPSIYLNQEVFVLWFGFPVQVLRAAMATLAAIFIVRSLRAFEFETHSRIEALHQAQLQERQHLEAIRGELLHRTVKAQETERQRIARELHDETGQTLTALGLGLRGLGGMIQSNPERASQQAQQLETLAVNGIDELQRMVRGLHPPQLDDLGLLPALRWYANEVSSRSGLPVKLVSSGAGPELSPDLRIVFFRVAQEAVTNAMRHAKAHQVTMRLEQTQDKIVLQVQDDGYGFDVEAALKGGTERPCWGLLGMIERSSLVGGVCQITSHPGQGTCVELSIPMMDGGRNGSDSTAAGR